MIPSLEAACIYSISTLSPAIARSDRKIEPGQFPIADTCFARSSLPEDSRQLRSSQPLVPAN